MKIIKINRYDQEAFLDNENAVLVAMTRRYFIVALVGA